MKNNSVKLSIITITYNCPDLKRTLNSVKSQQTKPDTIEHIIVDNLSNDDTPTIVKNYLKEASYKVTYIREKDKGRYDAMNKGIKIAKGDYLSFMNAGDYFYNQDSVKNILDYGGKYDIIYGNLNVITEDKANIYCPPDSLNFKYFLNSALPHQASIIKKDLFTKIGLYDDSLKISADHNFFLLAICKYNCSYHHLNKSIATYYFDGISSKPENIKIIEKEKSTVLNRYFSQINIKKIKSKTSVTQTGFNTPILFIIFNRPDTTQKVLNEIKKLKPKYLYIAADGPRHDKPGEAEKCQQTRNIIKQINWPCELKTLFRTTNFGCGQGVSKAITWFFDNVEEGIILEDDCVPSPSFFAYCQELLEKYRHDNRIMHINGTSFVIDEKIQDSYYFSKYYHVWGWATWRRAWNLYDFSIRSFPEFQKTNQIQNIFSNQTIQNFWLKYFNDVFHQRIDTWDYQWVYANLVNHGLSIMPFANQISNIGFGVDAAHTTNEKDKNANQQAKTIHCLQHPSLIIPNTNLDNIIYTNSLGLQLTSLTSQPLFNQIFFKIKNKFTSKNKYTAPFINAFSRVTILFARPKF